MYNFTYFIVTILSNSSIYLMFDLQKYLFQVQDKNY